MNTTVTVALALGSLVVLVAAVALRLADRLGLPSLLLYLALGLTLGENGLGIQVEDGGGSARVVRESTRRATPSWPVEVHVSPQHTPRGASST